MAFSNVFALAKELSSLRKLNIYGMSDTEMPQGLVLAQMIDKFRPLSPNSMILSITEIGRGPENELAQCLAILAILCPTLMEFRVYSCWFRDIWLDKIKEEGYEDYKGRLKQTLVV